MRIQKKITISDSWATQINSFFFTIKKEKKSGRAMASEQPRSRRAPTVGHMSFSSDCRSQKIARRELLALLRR